MKNLTQGLITSKLMYVEKANLYFEENGIKKGKQLVVSLNSIRV